MRTPLTHRLGIDVPIMQAPMAGGGDTPALVAGTSEAGGLGCIGAAYLTPDQIRDACRTVRSLTSRPYGINLFAPLHGEAAPDFVQRAVARVAPYYEELGLALPAPTFDTASPFNRQLEAVLESDAALFSFTFGLLPGEAMQRLKSRGILVAGTATHVQEARALADSGVDAIIAQGSEAGGHRGTFIGTVEQGMVGTMALVPQIIDSVSLPVVASGGIMDGRGIAAALALGAAAVQMGTAFLTCDEAGISDAYKAAILAAGEDQTRLTRAFSGRFARGIVNRFMEEVEPSGDILPFPLQNSLTRPLRREASRQGRAEFLSLWAGQGLRLARRQPVRALMERLINELAAPRR